MLEVGRIRKEEETRWHTQPRTHVTPMAFSVPKRNKKFEVGRRRRRRRRKKVSLMTHATPRGMGKKVHLKTYIPSEDLCSIWRRLCVKQEHIVSRGPTVYSKVG